MVYENKNYVVVVGMPPKTPDFPEPVDAYLVFNKETGVMEYFHSILYYVKQHADHLSDLLEGKFNEEADRPIDKVLRSFN